MVTTARVALPTIPGGQVTVAPGRAAPVRATAAIQAMGQDASHAAM